MKRSVILVMLFLLPVAQVSTAANWYIGPDGKAANPGTRVARWDIASALDGKQQIAAGDTIYLLEGTYKRRPAEFFEVRLADMGEKVRVETGSFFKNGETFRLMNPHDLYGETVAQGKCSDNTIDVPVKSEFAVFVVLKNG